jgi:hypothetical protein
VTIIKQGYLTKRSQGKGRHDWKRRFFVLDSTGMMYYYSHKVGRCVVCVSESPCAVLLAQYAVRIHMAWSCRLFWAVCLGPAETEEGTSVGVP